MTTGQVSHWHPQLISVAMEEDSTYWEVEELASLGNSVANECCRLWSGPTAPLSLLDQRDVRSASMLLQLHGVC